MTTRFICPPRLAIASAVVIFLSLGAAGTACAATVSPDYALTLDGSTQFGSTPAIQVDMENAYMSAWVTWGGSTGAPDGNQMIVYNGNSACGGWGVMIDDASGEVQILVGGIAVLDTGATVDSQVHNIAALRSNGTYQLFVDDVEWPVFGNDAPLPLGSCSPDLFLIGSGSDGPAQGGFSGTLDDVLVSQGPTFFAAASTGKALRLGSNLADWPFNEGRGTVATDTHGRTMGLEGNPPQWVPGRRPTCAQAVASPGLLWPPNHKLVPIQISGVTDPAGSPVSLKVTSIFQDEPVTGGPDGTGLGTSGASVRSDRNGGGNGRVYHIGFTATNSKGFSCDSEVTVGVPHSQGHNGGPVDGGALYDSTHP
jgi:hypothetical protein